MSWILRDGQDGKKQNEKRQARQSRQSSQAYSRVKRHGQGTIRYSIWLESVGFGGGNNKGGIDSAESLEKDLQSQHIIYGSTF